MLRVGFLICFLLLCTLPPSRPIAHVNEPEDVVDLELYDNGLRLGLVTAMLSQGSVCIMYGELLHLLGISSDHTYDSCMSSEMIRQEHDISISIDLSKMRASIEPGSNYPAKAYSEALRRMQSLSPSQEPPSKSINYIARMMPELRHVSASVHRYSASDMNPDLKGMVSGNLLRGDARFGFNLVDSPISNRYTLLDHSANIRYVLNTPRNIIRSIDIGTNLNDRDAFTQLNGLRISNIPLSRRPSIMTRPFNIDAPPGSIIEWMPGSPNQISGVVQDDNQHVINAPLNYGLNHFQYWVTAPNKVTETHWLWQKVPSRHVPKRALEYEFLHGIQSYRSNVEASLASLRYGLSEKISLGVFGVRALRHKAVQQHAQFEMVVIPTKSSDVLWAVNSDGDYQFQLSYWKPSGMSVDLGSTTPKSFRLNELDRTERHNFGRIAWNSSRWGRINLRFDQYQSTIGWQKFTELTWTQNLKKSTISAHVGQTANKRSGSSAISQSYLRFGSVSRLGTIILLSPDIHMTISPSLNVESIRLHAHFNKSMVQFGVHAYHLPNFKQTGIGINLRMHTDWLTVSTRNEVRPQQLYSYQSVQTTWSKSARGLWHPISQSGPQSSGVRLIPFFDSNSNGKLDAGEPTLSGLRGQASEARTLRNVSTGEALIFTELQPYHQYRIVLDRLLNNLHEYIVPVQVWKVEAPGSGILTVHIPVAKSIEAEGTWSLASDTSINPSTARLVFTSLANDAFYEASLFGDGTWYLDAIPTGSYRVSVRTGDDQSLQANPEMIAIDGSETTAPIIIKLDLSSHRSVDRTDG